MTESARIYKELIVKLETAIKEQTELLQTSTKSDDIEYHLGWIEVMVEELETCRKAFEAETII